MNRNFFTLLLVFSFYGFGLFSQNDQQADETKIKRSIRNVLIPQPSYSVPEDSEKLRPRKNKFKLHFGRQRMGYNIWAKDYLRAPSLTSDILDFLNQRSYDTPKMWQFRMGFEPKAWLKIGVLTHHRKGFFSETHLTSKEPRVSGNYDLAVDFTRSWGTYVEFTPFPVKNLRTRRYEFNLGAAYILENISILRQVSGGYNIDLTTWGDFGEVKRTEISPWTVQLYGSASVFLLPWLSTQLQVGYYIMPTINFDPIYIDLPPSYTDFQVSSDNLSLSWHYYSLGLNIHL